MTRNTFSPVGSRMRVAVVLVILVLGAAVVLGQTPASGAHHDAAAEQGKPQASAMIGGQKDMAEQQAMRAKMAAADQKLDQLVAKMNAAKGDEKTAAIAAVVTELVAQRRQMQEQMTRMQSGMMDQMMARMAAMHGTGGMMNKAPTPAPEATAADHAAHHPEK